MLLGKKIVNLISQMLNNLWLKFDKCRIDINCLIENIVHFNIPINMIYHNMK
jgi:hypothetical protein